MMVLLFFKVVTQKRRKKKEGEEEQAETQNIIRNSHHSYVLFRSSHFSKCNPVLFLLIAIFFSSSRYVINIFFSSASDSVTSCDLALYIMNLVMKITVLHNFILCDAPSIPTCISCHSTFVSSSS